MTRDTRRLYLAWVVALAATLGSLSFSEGRGFVPCVLCWFQRVALYPLALLLGIAAPATRCPGTCTGQCGGRAGEPEQRAHDSRAVPDRLYADPGAAELGTRAPESAYTGRPAIMKLAVMPPSTGTIAPVRKLASELPRK